MTGLVMSLVGELLQCVALVWLSVVCVLLTRQVASLRQQLVALSAKVATTHTVK